MAQLPGKDTSLWLDTTPETKYPTFGAGHNDKYNVVVAGGGIAGILTAWQLQKAGLKTALVEKDRIIQNTTGNTTAKLTSQHNLVYDFLISEHGREVAQAFADANQQAIEDIEATGRILEVDHDFSRRAAYVYTEKANKVKDIKTEVATAKSLGLPASFVTKLDLPFSVKGAIKFSLQAQFHPRKFLLAVAQDYVNHGGVIFEQTEASDIKTAKPNVLKTNKGELSAPHIVVATKYPFWQRKLFEKDTWVKLSYALGVILKDKNQYPQGMYINAEEPVRTIRSHPYKGDQIMIFGGESHKITKDYDKNEHYKNLVEDVHKRFDVDKIVYRWIAGDMMPNDRMPHIGAYPGQDNIHVITGFRAWGLGWGMIAAEIISDTITGRANSLKEIFSPSRLV